MTVSADQVVEGLVSRGVPRHAAIALAGNFVVESGLNPGINEIAPLVEGSRGGFGLAQWTGPRRRQFEEFAQGRGRDVSDLETQLDFTVWELNNTEKSARDAIYGTQDPVEAARVVSQRFLRPGIPHLDRRLNAARQIAAGEPVTSGPIQGGAGDATMVGQSAGDQVQTQVVQDPQAAENIYRAFVDGRMSPAQQAEYVADVRAGRISIPTGASLYDPVQVELPQIESIYRAYVDGRMSEEQRQEYEGDVRAGVMPLPPSATIQMGQIVPVQAGQPLPQSVAPVPTTPAFSDPLEYLNRPEIALTDAPVPMPSQEARNRVGEFDIARDMASQMGGDIVGPSFSGVVNLEGSPGQQLLPNAPGVIQRGTNLGLGLLGTVGAATGAATGFVGDVAESYGMPNSNARRLTRELAAIPEAFMGSPTSPIATAQRAVRQVSPPVDRRLAAIAAGERTGIPVMTSDVISNQTWAGRWLSSMGEKIPVTGTGGARATQADARETAIRNVLQQYSQGGDRAVDEVLASVSEDFINQRSERLYQYVEQKTEVINRLSGDPVPVDNFNTAIDAQIERMNRLGTTDALRVQRELEALRGAAQGKDLATIEDLRRQLGDMFTGQDSANVRSLGETVRDSLYAPLRDDMGAFIRENGERRDFTQWSVANARLSGMASELNLTGIRNVLRRGEATPEVVGRLLFSNQSSDVARLYRDLSPEGRANARQAILHRVYESVKNSEGDFSATRFQNELNRMSRQTGIFFRGEDRDAIQGLARALEYTRQADRAAVSTPTGQQILPFAVGSVLTDVLGGMGAATASIIGVGGLARIYESRPVRNALIRVSRAPAGSDAERQAIVDLQIVINNQIEAVSRLEATTRDARQIEEE